jgi:uncharacterized protein
VLAKRSSWLFWGAVLPLLILSYPAALRAQIPPCKGLRPGGLRLATGSAGGSYLRAGTALRDIAPELEIRPCSTAGTLENLALLSSNDVELALGQSDMLHAGWNLETLPSLEQENGKTWDFIQFKRVALVSWLFSERLQVLTSAHSYVSSMQDLRGKKIWRGLENSGAYLTAGEVLRAAGLDGQVKPPPTPITDYTQANRELLNGRIDAIFRISAVPMEYRRDLTADETPSTISELFRQGPEIRMLNLDQPLVDRLLEGSPYVGSTIYRDSYPRQSSGVRTIGLGSMLLTRQGLTEQEEKKVASLYRILHSWKGRRAAEKAMNIELDLLDRKLDPAIVDDARILNSYVFSQVSKDLELGSNARYLWLGLLAISAVAFFVALFHSEWLLINLVNRSKYLVTAGILVTACAGFALVLWFDERKFSPAFGTPVAAVESLFLYFAHGMKSDAVMTENGQFFALLALAVIATLVHRLHSDALDDSVDTWSKQLSNLLHGRVGYLSKNSVRVVVNWNDLAKARVEEWCKNPNKKDQVMVLGLNPVEALSASFEGKVKALLGDPAQRKCLQENLAGATSVLICSNWRSPYPEERRRAIPRELADNLTIRTIYAIRSLTRGGKSRYQIPIVAEILLPTNEEEAKAAGAPNVEIVGTAMKVMTVFPSPPVALEKAATTAVSSAN